MCGHWRSPLDAQASVAQTNANDTETPYCLVSIENPTANFSIGGSTVRLATQHRFFVGVMEGLAEGSFYIEFACGLFLVWKCTLAVKD